MATKDYYLNSLEQQVSEDFSEDSLRYLLHYTNGNKMVNQQELDWFCAKRFGDNYRFAQDALFQGEVIEGISLEILR